MSQRLEVCLAGAGGQGLILSGVILAEAAMEDGKNVVQSESYGPEARGGASRSDVIISDERIGFPTIMSPDVILVMSQAACDALAKTLKPGGLLLHDADLVKSIPQMDARVVAIPLTRIAKEVTGRQISANIVAIGALNAVAGMVSQESLVKATSKRVPAAFLEANMKALDAGYQEGLRMSGSPAQA